MARTAIVIADDHAMFRHGLKRILQERHDLAVVGEAADGLELLKFLRTRKQPTDLIILDISMPNLRGLEAVHEVRGIAPGVKVLVLTMHREKEYLYQAVSAGANGYLLKEDADGELLKAIESVRSGKFYVSPKLSESLTEEWLMVCSGGRLPEKEREPLTVREKEIMKMIAEGKSSRETAHCLCISVRTVEYHRANIMRKLCLNTTADLVRYALGKGYIR